MNPDVIIDCVGGQDIEDASRQALGNRGHFVTIMGPGSGAFGDGGDGAKEQMVQGMKIASRSVTSNYKYFPTWISNFFACFHIKEMVQNCAEADK